MIFYLIFFFDINLNYFKFSENKGFYINNSLFFNKTIINVNDRFSTKIDFINNRIDFIDNKFSLGLSIFDLTIASTLGYKKIAEKEIYYGTIIDYKKNLGNIGIKLGYELNLLKEFCENIINMNLEVIDTFFLKFSLNAFLFSKNQDNSYLGTISASFMLPYKLICYGGGLSFKFFSKGDLITETSYFNHYSPVNIFFKICYNNRKKNENVKLIISVKNDLHERIECNMKLNDRVYKIKDEKMIEILPGKYRIKFYRDGYEDFDTTMVILDNSNLEVILNSKKSFINLMLKIIDKDEMTGIDADVEIIENNIIRMKCDKYGICNIKIVPGSYVLRISKEGYLTRGIYLDIEDLENVEKMVTLQRLR